MGTWTAASSSHSGRFRWDSVKIGQYSGQFMHLASLLAGYSGFLRRRCAFHDARNVIIKHVIRRTSKCSKRIGPNSWPDILQGGIFNATRRIGYSDGPSLAIEAHYNSQELPGSPLFFALQTRTSTRSQTSNSGQILALECRMRISLWLAWRIFWDSMRLFGVSTQSALVEAERGRKWPGAGPNEDKMFWATKVIRLCNGP